MKTKMMAAAIAAVLVTAGPARAKDHVEVVASSFGFLYLTVLTGMALGYYDDAGIDVNYTATGGGTKALAAVMGGDAHIYMGAPVSAIRAREKGADVSVYGAGMTQYASNVTISKEWAEKHHITDKSTYEDRLKAMKGGTFAMTSVGSGTDQLIRFLAKEAGLDPARDVTITALGTPQTMLAALGQNRISGFSSSSPTGEQAVKNMGATMLFNLSRGQVKKLDGFLYIAAIAKDTWADSHKELMVRFLQTMQRTLDAIHGPKSDEARDKTWKRWHSKTDKDLYNYTWDNNVNAFPKTIHISKSQIDRVISYANTFEKTPLDEATARAAFNGKYADEALAKAGVAVPKD